MTDSGDKLSFDAVSLNICILAKHLRKTFLMVEISLSTNGKLLRIYSATQAKREQGKLHEVYLDPMNVAASLTSNKTLLCFTHLGQIKFIVLSNISFTVVLSLFIQDFHN